MNAFQSNTFTLQEELYAIEPRLDFLHVILGYGPYDRVIKDSSGVFYGMFHGEATFLGKPDHATLERTQTLLDALSLEKRCLAWSKSGGLLCGIISLTL